MLLPNHRCHDYQGLIRRWKSLARQLRLRCRVYDEIDGFPLFVLETPTPIANAKNIYISAGIHGDEPAGTEGLLAWAEKYPKVFQKANFLIFPCLNPWGLLNNCRYDASKHDLNRSFHEDVIPSIRTLKSLIPANHFDLALTLHEDFDGQGVYIYEVDPKSEIWSPRLLEQIRSIIPVDGRKLIDKHRVSGPGYLCRRPGKQIGVVGPEALFLHQRGARHIFTVETPSEFSLDARIAAQQKLVQTAVLRIITGHWQR